MRARCRSSALMPIEASLVPNSPGALETLDVELILKPVYGTFVP